MNILEFHRHDARADILGSRGVLLLGAVVCGCSFAYYFANGLSTVHYDAKAHLVVARRIVDSAAPGYAQMGAHWLPLIHLLYLPFVALDSQYHSAFLPSLISVLALVLSAWLTYRIALRLTGSIFAGWCAASALLANQNLLFLQSAPLTEPVFLALVLLAMDGLSAWRAQGAYATPCLPALWMALAALCRYEGWLFLGAAIVLILYDRHAGRISWIRAGKAIAAYLGLFAVPMAVHFGYIYFRLGDSFFHRVARGNPAPYETYQRPLLSIFYHVGELAQAAGLVPLFLGVAGLAFCLYDRRKLDQRLPYLLLWLPSVANIAALYWGLIYRVRYSALLLPAVAVFGSLLIDQGRLARRIMVIGCFLVILFPWISWLSPSGWEYHFVYPGPGMILLPASATVLMLASLAGPHRRWPLLGLMIAAMLAPAFEGEQRPVLAESVEHAYLAAEQQEVLTFLRAHYDGSRILIDSGRSAPLMYDSRLPLKEFICHDGDLRDWNNAIQAPLEHAGWLCAEKGDEIWGLLHVDPRLADGYSLAVSTENYVLYQSHREELRAPFSTGQFQ
jgi:hypothetical protein